MPIVTQNPPTASCMAELGRTAAYGNYWLVKGPMFLSGYAIHMAPILPSGDYYDWNTNRDWLHFDARDGTPVTFDTIIVDLLLPARIEKIYGTPARIETCRGITYWLYDAPLPLPPNHLSGDP